MIYLELSENMALKYRNQSQKSSQTAGVLNLHSSRRVWSSKNAQLAVKIQPCDKELEH